MKIPLDSAGRRTLVAFASAVAALAYLGYSATQFAASWLSSRTALSSLQWAARLDPGNAAYREKLGGYYDLVARDPASAVSYYQAATKLNPHSARYWFDLSSAYQVLGDVANQSEALEHAIEVD